MRTRITLRAAGASSAAGDLPLCRVDRGDEAARASGDQHRLHFAVILLTAGNMRKLRVEEDLDGFARERELSNLFFHRRGPKSKGYAPHRA